MFQECNAICLRHPHLECARCYLAVEVRSGPLQSPVPLQQRLLHHNPPQRQKGSKARQNIANMEELFKNVGNQSTSNQMNWTAWVAALALTHLSGNFFFHNSKHQYSLTTSDRRRDVWLLSHNTIWPGKPQPFSEEIGDASASAEEQAYTQRRKENIYN